MPDPQPDASSKGAVSFGFLASACPCFDPQIASFWDFWGPVLFTLALYLGIRHYVAEARFIPSGSMLPGLQIQDRLLVEKLTYAGRPPRRGELWCSAPRMLLIQR